MVTMRLKVPINSASGWIISSLARETGCGFQDHQISARFGKSSLYKIPHFASSAPATIRGVIPLHVEAIDNLKSSQEKGGRGVDGPKRTQN